MHLYTLKDRENRNVCHLTQSTDALLTAGDTDTPVTLQTKTNY